MNRKNFRGKQFYQEDFRGRFDEQGFSRDPVERAAQILPIQKAAKSGSEYAKKWMDDFIRTGCPPSSHDSCLEHLDAEQKNNTSDSYTLPFEYQGILRSENPKEDFAEYDFYMNTLISKANNGDVDALETLREQDFTFAPTRNQPFNPKIFDSYQEHNKFFLDIERKYNPRIFSSFSNDEPEFYYMRERYNKMSTDLLYATGQNTLDKKEIKELKTGVKGLTEDKKRLEKKIKELEKFIESDNSEYRPKIEDDPFSYGKVPPQAVDLEEILLGSALMYGSLIEDISLPYLTKMFYKETHQKIHKAMMDVKGKLTLPKVVNRLRDTNELESVGGPVYIESLIRNAIDDTKVLKSYFGTLEYKYLRREVIRLTTEIQQEAFKDEEVDSIPEWVRGIALKFMDVMPYRFKIYYDLDSIVGQTVGNFHKLINRDGKPEISTGYLNLDKITHGISPGTLLFNGMRGKNGKTTLSTNIGDNVAQQNRHVLIFTYETSKEEVIHKLISKRARVDLEKLVYFDEDNPLTNDEKERIDKASEEVQKLPIILESRPAEPDYVVRMSRFYKGMYPDLSLVIIDGIQAFANKEMPKGKNKSDYLYDFLATLKNDIAIDLNTMVWVNGQLKSDVEKRRSKRPMGSGDYSDCKGITEVADIAIQGYRPGKYFKKPQFQGWIALWPTDTRSGTEHGRACRLGFEEEYANVHMLLKSESTFDYAKYDALLHPARLRKNSDEKKKD